MKALFSPSRIFLVNNMWYISLREGDEMHDAHHINPITKRYSNLIVAGPFNDKSIAQSWLMGFIWVYGCSRLAQYNHRPAEEIILSSGYEFDWV